MALGERIVSDRKLRRAGRDAASLAQHAARAHQQIDAADDAARPAPEAAPATDSATTAGTGTPSAVDAQVLRSDRDLTDGRESDGERGRDD